MLHIKTMSKKFLITIALAAPLLISGGYFIWQRQQAIPTPTSVVTELYTFDPAVDIPVQTESVPELAFSSQHITAIPGSNQVWYEIPEMGIKLLLSKEAAEELVYKYSSKRDAGIFVEVNGLEADLKTVKDVEGASFSSKHVLEYNKTCNRPVCGTDDIAFSFAKVPGKYMNEELAFGMKFLKQFKDFYLVTGAPPQAVPFVTKDEEEWFYQNIGPKMPSIPPLKDIYIDLLESE